MSAELSAELARLYRAWFDAIGVDGTDWFDLHLADDFAYVTLDGELWDKARLIQVNRSVTGTELAILELSASELADGIALVLGRYSARAVERSAGNSEISETMRAALGNGVELRWTGLWRRTPGGWRAFLHHVTPVAANAL